MIFNATVSNKTHPAFKQTVIPFPIPNSEYDRVIDHMGIGTPTGQDCQVDRPESQNPILNQLTAQNVNIENP